MKINYKYKGLIVIASILFLCNFLLQTAQAESTLEKIKREGKFRAGVRFDYPPFGYIDPKGKNAGHGPDLAREFAKKLGVDLEFVQVTSKTRIPLLAGGMHDADIGPSTCSVKRDKVIDCSIPYVWDATALLVRKGESLKLKDYGPPKVVSTTQGSICDDMFKAPVEKGGAGVPDAKFKLFQEYTDCVMALLQKKVDAVLLSKFVAHSFTKKYPELEVGEQFFQDPNAILVRENDSDWRDWINFALQELWRDGVYQKIYEKNFGIPPDFKLYSPYRLQPGID